jgi:hypothetical protein
MTEIAYDAESGRVAPPAYKRWFEAEQAARQAEDRLHQQWVGFFFGGQQPPSPDDQRKAAVLRSLAHVALGEARREREAMLAAEERVA